MNIEDLTLQIRASGLKLGYVERTITAADLTGTTSQTFAFTGFPAKAHPTYAVIKVDTVVASSDTGNTDGLTVAVGDAGDPDEIGDELDVYGDAVGQQILAPGVKSSPLGDVSSYEASYSPIVTCVVTHSAAGSPDLDHISAGSFTVRLYYVQLGAYIQ